MSPQGALPLGFRLLLIGSATSLVGDLLLVVAFPLFVYQLTGSALLTSAAALVESAPKALLSSAGGSLADRMSRTRLLQLCDLVSALGVLVLLGASESRLWVCYAALLLLNSVAAFFAPTFAALVPDLVPTAELGRANAQLQLVSMSAAVVVPALGALVYDHLGFTVVVVLDAVSFVLSAIVTSLVRTRGTFHTQKSVNSAVDTTMQAVGSVWPLIALMSLSAALGAGLGPLLVPFLLDELAATPTNLAVMSVTVGLSGVLTGLVINRSVTAVGGGLLRLAALAQFALVAALAATSEPWQLVLLLALSPAPSLLLAVFVTSRLQAAVPRHLMGRVMGVNLTALAWSGIAGQGLGFALIASNGVRVAMVLLPLALLPGLVVVLVRGPEVRSDGLPDS